MKTQTKETALTHIRTLPAKNIERIFAKQIKKLLGHLLPPPQNALAILVDQYQHLTQQLFSYVPLKDILATEFIEKLIHCEPFLVCDTCDLKPFFIEDKALRNYLIEILEHPAPTNAEEKPLKTYYPVGFASLLQYQPRTKPEYQQCTNDDHNILIDASGNPVHICMRRDSHIWPEIKERIEGRRKEPLPTKERQKLLKRSPADVETTAKGLIKEAESLSYRKNELLAYLEGVIEEQKNIDNSEYSLHIKENPVNPDLVAKAQQAEKARKEWERKLTERARKRLSRKKVSPNEEGTTGNKACEHVDKDSGMTEKTRGSEYNVTSPVENNTGEAPPHPGELMHEVIKEHHLSIYAAAHEIDVNRIYFHNIIKGDRSLSHDVAAKFAAHFSEYTEDELLWTQMKYGQYKYHQRKALELAVKPTEEPTPVG